MSLHHLAIMTKPSLSCLLCFLCMLAIPIFPFLKFEEFLIYLYHKGAVTPLYIGIVHVGQHRSHTFGKSVFPWHTQSVIRLHERVPMVKIWGSSKKDQNWTRGKLLKLYFTILHLLLVVDLLLLLQFRLAYLNNHMELRNETLRTDRYP